MPPDHPPQPPSEPTGLPPTRTSPPSEPSEGGPKRTIGPYLLLQRLGEGGMGEVWLAQQEHPIRRRVALKLIKAGMDTKNVLARFEAERQALAMMNHPCIARVFDAASTEQGHPYFAMEYVDGEPITDYCDRHRLDTRERLELFIHVCEGVQHAHQKGVIHRDLKPSNVLVRIQDDKPVPKIIDFGVAKATDQSLTERTLFTELGMVVGTPEFMSPEQAEMSGLDVDTRTDVYSLGVMLYVLLAGALPFDSDKLRRAGYDGIRKTIREEEPARPSTRVSSLGAKSSETAEQRRTDPVTLKRLLSGDLDWITMKALEKDRTRRYDSPSELAAEIRRHLVHQPVLAGPPSALYRAKKFVRRHRVGVATAAAILVLLVAATAVSTVLYFRAEAARAEAETQAYSASLAAAVAALERNDTRAVRRHLSATAKRLRGWEWDWLWNESDRSLGTPLQLPPRGAYCLALSPDGTLLAARAAGGNMEPIRVYDVQSGKMLHELPMRETFGFRLAFSEDNRFLAYDAASPRSAQVWDLRDGRPLISMEAMPDYAGFLAFDPSGERVALLSPGIDEIVIYGLSDWRVRARVGIPLPEDVDPGVCGAFSPDGRLLAASVEASKSTLVIDATSGTVVRRLDAPGIQRACRFSPDGERLALLGTLQLRVYDTRSWDLVATIEDVERTVDTRASWRGGDVAFAEAAGSTDVLAGGPDGVLSAFRPDGPFPRFRMRGETSPARSIVWDRKHDRLVTAHERGVVRTWPRVPSWTWSRTRPGSHLGFLGSALLQYGTMVRDNDVRMVLFADVTEPRVLGALRQFPVTVAHSAAVIDWASSPDGRSMALVTSSGWSQGRLKIFDLAAGVGTFAPEPFWGSDPRGVAWSPDGKWIAVVGDNGFVRVFDAAAPERWVEIRGHRGSVNDVLFPPREPRLFTAGSDGTLRAWNPETGEPLGAWTAPDSLRLTCMALLEERGTIACGTTIGSLVLWDLRRETFSRPLTAHSAGVLEIASFPDGKRVVSGALDGSLVFWDPKTWREIVSLRLQRNLTGLAVSPDGARLAFGGEWIEVLDARPEEERQREREAHAEARRAASSWVDDLEREGLAPAEILRRIETSTVQGEAVKESALMEFLSRREPAHAAAYDTAHAAAIARPRVMRQVLRDLCVTPEDDRWWLDFREAAAEVRALPGLSDVEKAAAVEYALAMRYWNHTFPELQGDGVWTDAIIREIVAAPQEQERGDYVLALGAAEELQGALPNVAEFKESLGFAQHRARLFREADTTLAASVSGRDAAAETWAFLALNHARLGRPREAAAAAARCGQAVARGRWRDEAAARALHAEARALVARPAREQAAAGAGRDSILALRQQLGIGNPGGGFELSSLGLRLWDRGDLEGAERLFRKCIDMMLRDNGKHYRGVAARMAALADLLHATGRDEEAERLLRDGLALMKEARGEEHVDFAYRAVDLGRFLADTGRLEEAEALLRGAAATFRKRQGETHLDVATALVPLAAALNARGRHEEADSVAREALDLCRRHLEPSDWRIGEAMCLLGESLRGAGRLDEAEHLLLDGYAILNPPGRWAGRRATAREQIAKLYESTGRAELASTWRGAGIEPAQTR
jgi:serine/threonine protein kinase/WD40 repeat protein/tetratricopeptide (TPR) repeat protein